ncbi:MAG TPA: hypothetical protein VJR29_10845 [bacterium]|nr:hypothetical protein [bacterium]
MLHVAIIVHSHDVFESNGYWMKEIAESWREAGTRVSVVRGPDEPVQADLAVLHVDLTAVPQDYLDLLRQYPTVLNGGVADTSKRLTSSHLVRRGDGYGGPVIVKTDRNFKGVQEVRLAVKGLLPRKPRDLRRNYRYFFQEAWRTGKALLRHGYAPAYRDYSIYDSAQAVPARLWGHPDLVVERFLPEIRQGHYCVRTWLFLGDREKSAIFYSKSPIVKSANILRQEPLDEVPEELRRIRRELKFDYGKFDYTVVDGRPVLFDANRTPTLGSFPKARYRPMVQFLSEGLGCFL